MLNPSAQTFQYAAAALSMIRKVTLASISLRKIRCQRGIYDDLPAQERNLWQISHKFTSPFFSRRGREAEMLCLPSIMKNESGL